MLKPDNESVSKYMLSHDILADDMESIESIESMERESVREW